MSIRLVTLGALHCFCGDDEVVSLLSQRHRLAVLTYLALERDVTRDQVMAVFWPERDADRARHVLSQTLYELRRALGEDWLKTRGDHLVVTPHLEIDAERFASGVQRGELDAALSLYGGPFLAGEYLASTQPFEEWVDRTRARLARLHRTASRDFVALRSRAGDRAGAIAAARRWVELEPLEDEAQHRLIELLAADGQRAEALRQFSLYERLLKAEDLRPLDETLELVARLRNAEVAAERPAASTTAPPTAVHAPGPDAQATDPAGRPPRAASPPPAAVPRGSRRRTLLVAGAAIAALAGAIALVRPREKMQSAATTVLDDRVFWVLPFVVENRPQEVPVDGAVAAYLTEKALARWEGVRFADPVRANELLTGRGPGHALAHDSALSLAARLNAGRLVRGIVRWRDTLVAEATLYDVARGGAVLSRAGVPLAPVPERLQAGFDALADSLLRGSIGGPGLRASARPVYSLDALADYRRGHEALASWDLTTAAERFASAMARDSGFAEAVLWSAQTMAWRRDTTALWRSIAARAASLAAGLPAKEALMARALERLAAKRFEDACRAYQALVDADVLSFAGWFGLGECRAADHVVVQDSASPSGWRFRASQHAAVEAYRQALTLAPLFVGARGGLDFFTWFEPLVIEPYQLRGGYLTGSDSLAFAAYPSLDHDTLAYVPWPVSAVTSGAAPARAPSHHAALRRNLDMLRELAAAWVRADPDEWRAYEVLAFILERRGDLTEGPSADVSALTAIDRARSLADGRDARLRLGVIQIRLQVRLGRFDAARVLADSLLADWPEPDEERARDLAPLAALTGRIHRTAALLARAAPADHRTAEQRRRGVQTAPRPVAEASMALLGYAAFGTPVDSIRALKHRVDELVDVWIDPDQRTAARRRLLDRALELAFPAIGLSDLHRNTPGRSLLSLQWALVHDGADSVLTRLSRLDRGRSGLAASAVTAENVLHESILQAAAGDSSGAAQRLDAFLDALPAMRQDFLADPARAAGVVRAMALRAEFADRAGEPEAAQRWARAVLAAWSDADAELSPLLTSMRDIVQRAR